MKHSLIGTALAFVLAGCLPAERTATVTQGDPQAAAPSAGVCGEGTYAYLVGQSAFDAVEGLIDLTSATPPRAVIVFPNSPIAYDYDPNRLMVRVGPDNTVTSVTCE